jgi:hypothetical protein
MQGQYGSFYRKRIIKPKVCISIAHRARSGGKVTKRFSTCKWNFLIFGVHYLLGMECSLSERSEVVCVVFAYTGGGRGDSFSPPCYRAVPVRLPRLAGCQRGLRVQTGLLPFAEAGRERVEDGAGGCFRLLHPFRNIDMKSDERSRDIVAWTGWTISSDPDHRKICSWLIRQIRAELKPCPLIQMGWFFRGMYRAVPPSNLSALMRWPPQWGVPPNRFWPCWGSGTKRRAKAILSN